MIITNWVRNTLRNKFRGTLLGSSTRHLSSPSRPESICFIAATRMAESDFWWKSPLGISLKPLLVPSIISADIKFSNSEGLPTIYNSAIKNKVDADILIFLHDDIWLEDPKLIEKIRGAVQRFDIVGVAGNRRIAKHQPAWLYIRFENGQFIWDSEHLSGVVGHGTPGNSSYSVYGPTPAQCELLDGVLLAGKRNALLSSSVFFDERFKFHFYDMDFCRSARRVGLSLGTWPLSIIHASIGVFGAPNWHEAHAVYKNKWKS
jgi:glycosyltransferase involved in cell wall biosynthesis